MLEQERLLMKNEDLYTKLNTKFTYRSEIIYDQDINVKNIKHAKYTIRKLISNTKKLENAYCNVQVDLGNLAKEHLNVISDIK